MTAKDIVIKFNLSVNGARYWVKKLKFSFKKKPFPIWKVIKKGGFILSSKL